MAINIFLGARRLALLLGVVSVAFPVLIIFHNIPSLDYKAAYYLATPNAPFKKTNGDCPSKDLEIKLNHETSSGKTIHVSICLEPMTFTNKKDYKSDPDNFDIDAYLRMQAKNAHEDVVAHIAKINTREQVEKRFTMTATDEEDSIKKGENNRHSKLLELIAEVMGIWAAGLVIFGALVWIIGWIVRGLLGIPHGMDKRPDLSTQTPAPAIDIIKSEKLKQYSVADELLKWAKLKEDGHITEEEFNEARKKILKRS